MSDLVYPELSYQVIGICYEIYNELGGGYQEKYYQKALSQLFNEKKINFTEQLKCDLNFRGKNLGRYFIDFVISDKIVLEIKVTPIFYRRDVKQVLAYLEKADIKLGILVSFNNKGVMFKRILRGRTDHKSIRE